MDRTQCGIVLNVFKRGDVILEWLQRLHHPAELERVT